MVAGGSDASEFTHTEDTYLNGIRELQRQLLKHAERVRCDCGEIIFRRGESGQAFYLIGRGHVRISVPDGRGEQAVTDLGPGEYFGEIALLTGEPRSATAIAITPTVLYRVTREGFWQLMNKSPALALEITRYLSRRLRARTLWKAAQPIRTVVVLAAEPAAEEGAFSLQFAQASSDLTEARVALIDTGESEIVPSIQDSNGAKKVALLRVPATAARAALDKYSLLVVRVHASSTTGTEWLEVADVVVLLDFPDRLYQHLLRFADKCRVLMCELHGQRPDPFCDTHVHPFPLIRLYSDDGRISCKDMRRLVRKVLGRQVGLALSAGGAKGLAHLGAVQVLEAAGIEFDMIAGTSMGGIVGGFLAMGQDSQTVLAKFDLLAKNFRHLLLDFGMPRISLLRGDKKRTLIEAHTCNACIEQLPITFASVAADLVSGREAVFTSGSLALALDATSAIPMIFPPVHADSRAYVDGWVVNPLPADVLRRLGADIVIAVDTSIQSPVPAAQYGNNKPQAWRMNSWRTNPAIASIAIRALEVSARERSLASLATVEVGITPNVDTFSPTDFRPIATIVERGAQAAENALPAIRAALRGQAKYHA